MNKDLRMEVFASKIEVKPVMFHVYELYTQKIDNAFSIIRGAAWKIRNYNHIGVFEDGRYIYTIDEIESDVPNADFTVNHLEFKELPVLENRKLYSELIKYFITQNLKKVKIMDKYYKYSCKSSVTSKWIMTGNGFDLFCSNNKEISLERKYNFWIDIKDNGKAYLRIDTSSVFTSNLTVYDYMLKGVNPIGMDVKNDWAKNNQTGTLVEICDFTVIDDLEFVKGGLKAYYINRKEGYRVEKLDDDTKVVMVKLNQDKPYPYYPQALKPVLTREKVGQIDSSFSMRIEEYVKRDMKTRLELDKDFISDIGKIAELSGLEFENDTCPVEDIGFKKGTVPLPRLVCGNDKVIECGKEFQVFNYGFYRKTEKTIKIGYIYPNNAREYLKAFANALIDYVKYGKYHGEQDKYTIKGLLDVDFNSVATEFYELGDITDYKRAANRLKKTEGMDIVVAIIPDGIDEDGPYNPFKTIWAKEKIPSQMISMKTAELFLKDKPESNKTKYYLHNIVLGIL